MNHVYLKRETKTGWLKKLEPRYKSKIAFSTQEGIHIVCTKDILFLRASGNYTQVHIKEGKKIVVSKTLKVLENQLPRTGFIRCHQSYVVNLEEVVRFHDSIMLTSKDEIPISRRKRNEFKSWFLDRVNFI